MSSPASHSVEVILASSHGLHARPATELVDRAQSFQSAVTIRAAGRQADCKSILDVLSCGCPAGAKITLTATGPDSREAARVLGKLLEEL